MSVDLFSQIKYSAPVNYISRDFDSLRRSLTDYIKAQFPDSFSDFSDQSAGMAILEAVCYANDILNYYIDRQFNEIFLDTAQEEKNVIALAKNLGYKVKGKSAATNNNLVLNFNYPTSGSLNDYQFILKMGTKFTSKNGDSIFELLHDIDTSSIASSTTTRDVANNVISASISALKIAAGVSKAYNVKIGNAIPYLKISLPETDVLEVTSITSSDGHTWYEVDYLAQENQFVGVINDQSVSGAVPYILTLKRVPRRFVFERETNGRASVRFGSGVLAQTDAEFIPNPEDFILPVTLRGTVSGFSPAAVDPSDFINTGTLGSTPSNVTLTIKYRTGGGLKSNAGAGTITQISERKIEYKTTGNTFDKSVMESTMKVNNPEPCTGGDEGETLDQIRYNASAFFAAQQRCVTLQDYIVRAYTLPSQFGSVFRATAMKDQNNKLGIKLAILARNADGSLALSSSSLKVNLVSYLQEFRSVSESINIVDAKIINLSCAFSIVTDKTYNQQEILANCLQAVKDFFDIRKWNLGQSISISLVSKALTDVRGVLAVPGVRFTQMFDGYGGRTYNKSEKFYNLSARTRNNIIECNPDQIFEIKYPSFDISGAILS